MRDWVRGFIVLESVLWGVNDVIDLLWDPSIGNVTPG